MGGQQQTIAQNEQLFPLQTLNTGAAALRGYQVPTSVNSTYTGPIPGAYSASPLQQIAGIGALLSGASTSASGQPTSFGNWLGTQLSKAGSGVSDLFGGSPSDMVPNPTPDSGFNIGDTPVPETPVSNVTYDDYGNPLYT